MRTARSIDVDWNNIRTSLAILAACVAASTQAQAHSSSCTPAHLMSALKQVEAECGSAKIISAHRPGARIRGTGHVSQHSFCNGTQRRHRCRVLQPRLRALGLAQDQLRDHDLRKVQHIHIGTDGWRNGANTNVARHNTTARTRVAARQRAAPGMRRGSAGAFRSRNSNGRTIRTAGAMQAGQTAAARRLAYPQRPGTRSASGRRAGVRVAQQQWSSDQNGWGHATWSNSGGAEAAYAQRPGARSASRRRAGVRVAQRQRSNDQNGWGGGNWSSNW